jgi:putative glutamine amidotransferase
MRMTGAVPMLIADHVLRVGGSDDVDIIRKQVESDLAKADGIIVMGNDSDIDPGDYGESFRHPKTNSEKATHEGRVRAAYEYKLIEESLKMKLPIFAVCGGMQRLNVLLGGTLHQHVPDLVGTAYHHQGGAGIAPFIPVQFVGVVPGTRLAKVAKELGGLFTPQHEDLPPGVFMENSFHHQAVDRVADGLIPCAFSLEPDKPDLYIYCSGD